MSYTSHYRRVGLIVPSSNLTMETEIPALLKAREAILPERFTFHSSRMRMKSVVKEELEAMDADSVRCATELSDAAVEVQAKDLAVEAVEVLAARPSIPFVPCGHQERVVGEHQQAASIVDACCREGQKHFFVHESRSIPIEHRQVLCAIPRRSTCVDHKHLGGVLPIRVHGHAQHAGLAVAVVGDRFGQHCRRGARLRVNAVHSTCAARHPKMIVRSPKKFPRNLDAGSDVRRRERGRPNLERFLS